MKSKILITGILSFSMFATLLPSCKKQEQHATKSDAPRAKVSYLMSRLWNPIVERCVGDPNYDCVKLEYSAPIIRPFEAVPAMFDDIFNNPTWQFGSSTDYDQAETQAMADAYNITTYDLNNLEGYDFFNLLFPGELSEEEFDDARANFSAEVYSDESENRVNIVFVPNTSLETLWAIEAEFEIFEP